MIAGLTAGVILFGAALLAIRAWLLMLVIGGLSRYVDVDWVDPLGFIPTVLMLVVVVLLVPVNFKPQAHRD